MTPPPMFSFTRVRGRAGSSLPSRARLADCRAMTDLPRPTRRAVLLGAVAVPLAGCRHHRQPPSAPPAPVDGELIASATAAERVLIAAYDGRLAEMSAPDPTVS